MIRYLVAFAVACALSCAPSLVAAQSFPQFLGPGGSYFNPSMTAVVGVDAATGAACLVGLSATCRAPVVGAANFAPAQVSIAATPTQIVAARGARMTLTVINTSSTAFYIGPSSSVTSATGVLIPAGVGVSITLAYSGALYAVTASGTATLSAYELY